MHGAGRAILAAFGAIVSLVDDPSRVLDIVLGSHDESISLDANEWVEAQQQQENYDKKISCGQGENWQINHSRSASEHFVPFTRHMKIQFISDNVVGELFQ